MFAFGNIGVLGIMAVEEDERLERHALIRQLRIDRKRLRDASNPFDVDPEHFRKHYRMLPHLVLDLVALLRHHIIQTGITRIEPHFQVLAALRFFAEGAYQKGAGQDYKHPLSQTSMSRCIEDVVNALVHVSKRFIQLPGTRAELQRVERRFRERIRIPGIIGIIDCLLVSFVRPVENEEAFFNHKGYHAMNVQIICDADSLIRDICICPGSNNDRFVWRFSDAKQYFEGLRSNEELTREEGRFYIIGDSGYTPSPVLLTPVRDPPPNSGAERYNTEIVGTRSGVERLFGIFTAVFRSIKRERKLCYRQPEKVGKIITACAVLHNFRKNHGQMYDEEVEEDLVNDEIEEEMEGRFDYRAGVRERNQIIRDFYD